MSKYNQAISQIERLAVYKTNCEKLSGELLNNETVDVMCGGLTLSIPSYAIQPLLNQLAEKLKDELAAANVTRMGLH